MIIQENLYENLWFWILVYIPFTWVLWFRNKHKTKILVDVGSSSLKIYELKGNKPSLLFTRSIHFKTAYDQNVGISEEHKEELFQVISEIKEEYPRIVIKTYATAFFRKLLESLMSDDPKWMHGARACSAIAQAIFEKYGIATIIPSDANLLDGVARKEFGA